MKLIFDVPANPVVEVKGIDMRYPIHRIFCVGRNYADHAKEMGMQVDREAPIYFTKSPSSFAPSGGKQPYAQGTSDYHYEMELVVALGEGGKIFGFACGLDMTRRDLQAKMRERGYPWDVAKNVEASAIIGTITPADGFGPVGSQAITLTQNGAVKQSGRLDDMIWSIPEIISDLSKLYHLRSGDVIFTGTPAGVGPVAIGDHLVGEVEGLEPVVVEFGPTEN